MFGSMMISRQCTRPSGPDLLTTPSLSSDHLDFHSLDGSTVVFLGLDVPVSGAVIFFSLGRFTHSWMPHVVRVALGISAGIIPLPAVIHCTRPSYAATVLSRLSR